jgi:hypothetical protein
VGRVEEWDLSLPLPENVKMPVAYDDACISALKACRDGTASPEQQRRAMSWIVWSAGTYVRTYHTDPFDNAYAAGRREHGVEIVKLLNSRTTRQSHTEQG